MNAYAKQYQNNHILSASPEQILIMLYDGAIRFTRQGILGIEENRPSLKLEGISRALAIIAEFSNTLDREVGGEIAEDLDALYHYMMRELNDGRSENCVARLRVVEGLLLGLRGTWAEAIEINRKASQPSVTAPLSVGDDDSRARLAVSM